MRLWSKKQSSGGCGDRICAIMPAANAAAHLSSICHPRHEAAYASIRWEA